MFISVGYLDGSSKFKGIVVGVHIGYWQSPQGDYIAFLYKVDTRLVYCCYRDQVLKLDGMDTVVSIWMLEMLQERELAI